MRVATTLSTVALALAGWWLLNEPHVDAPQPRTSLTERSVNLEAARREALESLLEAASETSERAGAMPPWHPVAGVWSDRRSGPSLSAKDVHARAASAVWMLFAAPIAEIAGSRRARRNAGQGSAVAVGPRTLLTNCHVVGRRTAVTLHRKEETFVSADVVAADRDRDTCILRAEVELTDYVPVFRHFDDLAVGEEVYAIGAPKGLDQSISDGIVSGKRTERTQGRSVIRQRIIQASAGVAPGSSGGGLFDGYGNLVGITAISIAGSFTFAISVDEFAR